MIVLILTIFLPILGLYVLAKLLIPVLFKILVLLVIISFLSPFFFFLMLGYFVGKKRDRIAYKAKDLIMSKRRTKLKIVLRGKR